LQSIDSFFISEKKLLIAGASICTDEITKKRFLEALSPKIDWKVFLSLLYSHKTGGLFYKSWNSLGGQYVDSIPEKVITEVKNIYFTNVLQGTRKLQKIKELIKNIQRENLQVIILRGVVLAENIYGDIGVRPWGDLDLLVEKKDWKKIIEILIDSGYQPHGFTKPLVDLAFSSNFIPLHCNFYTSGSIVEIHTDPLHLSISMSNSEKIWERARPTKIDGLEVLWLSPEDLLISLCLHLNRFGFNRLLWFSDINELMKKFQKDIDWEYVIDISQKEDVGFSIYFTLKRLKEIFNSPFPTNVLSKLFPSPLHSFLFNLVWKKSKPIDWEAKENNFSAIWLRFLSLLSSGRLPEKLTYLKQTVFPPLEWVSVRENLPRNSKKLFLYYVTRPLKPLKFLLKG